MKQSRGRKQLGLKNISSCCSSKLFEKTRIQRLAVCRLQEPVAAVSFLYPVGFWSHHFVPGLILPRTGQRLSKRPSNNSLIHFYKRCVSMALSFSIDHIIYSGSKKVHWTNKQKIIGTGKHFKLLLFKIIWEDSHSKTSCLQEEVWPVVAVSFLYPDGFWPHHLVSGLMLPRTCHRLSKRPSNNSLIHFYKRCVSMALRLSIDHSIYSGSKKIHWIDEKCLRRWQ